jgi:hypothetical protein
MIVVSLAVKWLRGAPWTTQALVLTAPQFLCLGPDIEIRETDLAVIGATNSTAFTAPKPLRFGPCPGLMIVTPTIEIFLNDKKMLAILVVCFAHGAGHGYAKQLRELVNWQTR